jgi:hypothetical protein
MFTTLAVAVCGCLLSAVNARPLAARLSSADTGATAASCPLAEPLLPLVALYFIMADCYVVALAPAPLSHCCSHHHHCHRFVTAHPRLRRNPLRKKKRQKSLFLFTTQLLTLSCRHSQKSFVINVRLLNLLVKLVRRKSHTAHLRYLKQY